MKHNQIIFSIIAGVIVFGGLYGVYKIVGGGPDEALLKKISEDRPKEKTMWNQKAKHTLAVFSDHQCPACKTFHEYLTSFEDEKNENNAVTKKVSYVFRYFPLYQIHEHAYSLAYAAEAAARQGKFEEANNRFFKDQVLLETTKDLKAYLSGVAKDLKLDENKFNTDMNDGALQSVIQDDLQFGEKLEVNSTPTFYLNGEKLENMSPAALTKLLLELE